MGNVNFGPRPWVPRLVGLVIPHLEGSEIPNLDLFSPSECFGHGGKEDIHDVLGLLLG